MIKNVTMMGGTLQTSGNVSPVSEANFYMDPAACDEVFRSGMDITVIGLDVTTKTRLRREHIQWLDTVCRSKARPAYAYLCSALEHYWTGNRIQNYCVGDCPVHDPLTMMAVMVPSLIKTQKRKARIECGGTYCRGMVVTDLREHPFEAEYVNFAVEVDQDRAIRELLSVFWEE